MDILRLLFIRLSALGDVVHALPAAAAIKKALPDTKLSWIAEPPQMELLRDNPLVDEIIEMPKSAWVLGLKNPRDFLSTQVEIFKFFSKLRAKKFDVAIDLQGLMKSALIGYISGAPIRIGYGGTRERADLLYTHRLEVGDFRAFDRHVVDLHLQLSERLLTIQGGSDVESSARAEFILPPPKISNRENIDNLFSELSVHNLDAPPVQSETGGGAAKSLAAAGKNGVVVMIPGTTWETKIWPMEKWGELGELIINRFGSRVILVGGPSDTANNVIIKEDIERRCPDGTVRDASGRTSISDLIELFGRVDLVVGLDTGPLHLAAAVAGCPVLAIHGATPWGRNGPYGERCATVHLELSCQPCFKRVCPLGTKECLTELSARHVFEQLEELV